MQTTPDAQSPFAGLDFSAWAVSKKLLRDADNLESLMQLKMENPTVTRKEALIWAIEMVNLYA